jgi:hypothetical protein
MTFENFIKGRLASFAAEEGMRYGNADCSLAVAQVLANRVREGWQGGDWLKVIDDAGNYRGTVHEEPFVIDPRSVVFRQVLGGVEDVYHAVADDSNVNVMDDRGTMVSLYYCELHNVTEPWFKDHILKHPSDHQRIAKVGELTFFS